MSGYTSIPPIGSEHAQGWQPVRHTVFRDTGLAEVIHVQGYKVVEFLDAAQLEKLRALYAEEHRLKDENGGMFYSLYSRDYAYRQKIHDEIAAVLQPSFERFFKDFQNVINTFIVKLPGPASEFSIHQDTSALDEYKHSPLSVWMPLQDITENNGAMCMVPKSHWFFTPYRGISFPFAFKNINNVIREYLEPVYLKAGQAVIFDNRVLHNSLPNSSDHDRVTIVSGIFPTNAEFQVCYKDPGKENAPIELFSQSPDYLLKYPNFLIDCHARPVTGEVIGAARFEMPQMTEAEFRKLCELNGVPIRNEIPDPTDVNCNMIGEREAVPAEVAAPVESHAQAATEPVSPDGGKAKKGFWNWFKKSR